MPKKLLVDNLNVMLRIANLSFKTTFVNEVSEVTNSEDFVMHYDLPIVDGYEKVMKTTVFKKAVYKICLDILHKEVDELTLRMLHKEDIPLRPYDVEMNVLESTEKSKVPVIRLTLRFH